MGRIHGCKVGTVRRACVDEPVLAHFEQTILDVEATRAQILAAMDRKVAEARALLASAEREARDATARLGRVRGDYVSGELTAAEWRELRNELEPEAAAAEAEAKRLREQLAIAASGAAVDDAEAELMEQLAQLRAAVAGDVSAAEGAEAVRAVLRRLFDRFIFHPEVPARAHVELIGTRYWIEPLMSKRAIAGYNEGLMPVFARQPPGLTGSPNHESESPYCSLFAPIPVGVDAKASGRARRDR
jgi:hypothetical protein